MDVDNEFGWRANLRHGLLGAAITMSVLAAGAAVVVIFWPTAAGTDDKISRGQFMAQPIGESKPDLQRSLGRPDTSLDLTRLPPPAAGLTCDYYTEVDTLVDPSVYRFCYQADLLTQKSEFTSLSAAEPIYQDPA